MEKLRNKLSFLTALNSIFIKPDDVISEEDKNEMQINNINSASELSEKDKELLLKSISDINCIEEQYSKSYTTRNITEKVEVNTVKAVSEANKKMKKIKDIEEKEKN